MPTPLLLRNGRVIDPSRNYDAVADLYLVDGTIAGTSARPDSPRAAPSTAPA